MNASASELKSLIAPGQKFGILATGVSGIEEILPLRVGGCHLLSNGDTPLGEMWTRFLGTNKAAEFYKANLLVLVTVESRSTLVDNEDSTLRQQVGRWYANLSLCHIDCSQAMLVTGINDGGEVKFRTIHNATKRYLDYKNCICDIQLIDIQKCNDLNDQFERFYRKKKLSRLFWGLYCLHDALKCNIGTERLLYLVRSAESLLVGKKNRGEEYFGLCFSKIVGNYISQNEAKVLYRLRNYVVHNKPWTSVDTDGLRYNMLIKKLERCLKSLYSTILLDKQLLAVYESESTLESHIDNLVKGTSSPLSLGGVVKLESRRIWRNHRLI